MAALDFAVLVAVPIAIAGLVAVRLVLVRERHGFDALINASAVFTALAGLLGEPHIVSWIAPRLPGGVPTIIDLWHWCAVLAFTCGLGITLRRKYGPVDYRARFGLVLGWSVITGVLLLVLSGPARDAGISIVALGGWRTTVYAGLYWMLPVTMSYLGLWACLTVWRETLRIRERYVAAMGIAFTGGTLLNAGIAAVGAVVGAAGIDTEFAHALTRFVARELEWGMWESIFALALALVLVPSLLQIAVNVLGLDESSRSIRRMRPLWADLTRAAPDVVLPLRWADRWGASPAERLYRYRIEMRDAADEIARHVRPLPPGVDELIDAVDEDDQEDLRAVTELAAAAQRLADLGESAGDTATFANSVPDEATLLRFWGPAQALLRTATPLSADGLLVLRDRQRYEDHQ